MATKPTEYPDWALNDEISTSGNANKVIIPEEWQLSGLKEGEPLPRAYLNQDLHLLGTWVRYFEDQIDALAISAASSIIQTIYPVGAMWIGDTDQDPSDILGFGTWERVEGKFLVGRDTGDTDFDGIGETGGSKTHTHTDTFSLSTSGGHSHDLSYPSGETVSDINGTTIPVLPLVDNAGEHTHNVNGSVDSSSNLPPYYTTNIWKRTA